MTDVWNVLVVDGTRQSRQAEELLNKFRVAYKKQPIETFSSIEVFNGDLPYLVTERGAFEGLDAIVEYLKKKGNLAMTEPKLPPPPFAAQRSWRRNFPQAAPPPANVEEAIAQKVKDVKPEPEPEPDPEVEAQDLEEEEDDVVIEEPEDPKEKKAAPKKAAAKKTKTTAKKTAKKS